MNVKCGLNSEDLNEMSRLSSKEQMQLLQQSLVSTTAPSPLDHLKAVLGEKKKARMKKGKKASDRSGAANNERASGTRKIKKMDDASSPKSTTAGGRRGVHRRVGKGGRSPRQRQPEPMERIGAGKEGQQRGGEDLQGTKSTAKRASRKPSDNRYAKKGGAVIPAQERQPQPRKPRNKKKSPPNNRPGRRVKFANGKKNKVPQDVPAADDASPLGDRGSHHSTVADEFYTHNGFYPTLFAGITAGFFAL